MISSCLRQIRKLYLQSLFGLHVHSCTHWAINLRRAAGSVQQHMYTGSVDIAIFSVTQCLWLLYREIFSSVGVGRGGGAACVGFFYYSIFSGPKYVKNTACLCEVCSLCPETGESSCHSVPASGFRYKASQCVLLYPGKQNKFSQKMQRATCQRNRVRVRVFRVWILLCVHFHDNIQYFLCVLLTVCLLT